MNLKRSVIKALGLIGVASTSQIANAQFGGLLGGGKSTGGGDVEGQINKFNSEAALISKAMSYAILQIQGALGSKEEREKIKVKVEALNKATDTKEINAIQGEIIKSDMAATTELMKSAEGKARMEKLEPEMQRKVAKSVFAVMLAGIKIKPMLDTGKNVIQGVGANPMMLTKIGPVKDGLTLFGDALPKFPAFAEVGISMLRTVKIDPGNPTADSKLEPDTSVTIPD